MCQIIIIPYILSYIHIYFPVSILSLNLLSYKGVIRDVRNQVSKKSLNLKWQTMDIRNHCLLDTKCIIVQVWWYRPSPFYFWDVILPNSRSLDLHFLYRFYWNLGFNPQALTVPIFGWCRMPQMAKIRSVSWLGLFPVIILKSRPHA